jgi:hypothetical protein
MLCVLNNFVDSITEYSIPNNQNTRVVFVNAIFVSALIKQNDTNNNKNVNLLLMFEIDEHKFSMQSGI